MIERSNPKLSVGAQCRLLSISRSSFHYAPQGETAMNLDLMLLIDKQFLDTPFYGVRQMTWHLQNEGHAVNQKRIRRLMRLMRLMPIYQKPDTSRPAKGHKTYPYLLGGLRVDRPNQVWCADITLASGKQSTGLFSDPPHPDAPRLSLSGGCHGLVHSQGFGWAGIEHA
jgi:putative transposase